MGHSDGKADWTGDLDELSHSLASSSTKQRLAVLARLRQALSKQGWHVMSLISDVLTGLR